MNELFDEMGTDMFEEKPKSKTKPTPYISNKVVETFSDDLLLTIDKQNYNTEQRTVIIKNSIKELRHEVSRVTQVLLEWLNEEKETPTYASIRWHQHRQNIVDFIGICTKLIWEVKKEKAEVTKKYAAGKMNEVFQREFNMLDVKKSWQDKAMYKEIIFNAQDSQIELLSDCKEYLMDVRKGVDSVLFNMRSFYDDFANRQKGMW